MHDQKESKNKEHHELKQQLEEMEGNWKRALADYKNLEKRVENEREQIGLFAIEMFIKKLLPVLDNLEKVETHLEDAGLKMTVKEFKQILTNSGLEEMKSTDEDFNPNEMEAIDMVEGEKNKVIETVLKGYLLGNKVLRPARVKVGGGNFSKAPAESEK